jgi:hypothetical protein
MFMSKNPRFAATVMLLTISVMAAGLVGSGCGGEQPPAPAPAPAAPVTPAPGADTAAPPAAAPVPPAAPAPVAAPLPADAPVTAAILQLTPAKAQIALALPPVNGTLAKLIPFAKRTAPPGISIDEEVQKIVDDMAGDLGAGDAKTFNDIALAKGLDLNAPVGVFADFTASVDGAVKAAESAKAAAPAPEAPATPGAEQSAPVSEVYPGVSAKIEFDDMEAPDWALVLGVSDQAKAEASLKELIDEVPELSGVQAEEIKVGDIAIMSLGKYGYFFAANKVALGNLEMVKGVAERFAVPAVIRYGTAECPPTVKDEAVALVFGGRALPLLTKALPLVEMDASMDAFLKAQMASMEAMLGGDGGEDPMVAALSWTDDFIQLESRMDSATHPAVLTISGPAAPLRLAQMLPESTLALLSLRLTEEYKKQITEVWLPSLPEEMKQEASFAQGVTIGKQVLALLGDEISLGITGIEADFPGVILMVRLSNAESTKGLLQMLVPMMPGETYNEVEISTIAAPIPVPLSIAFVGDMVMVSNSVDEMKKIVDLNKENKYTELFAKLEPPLDAATPRYSALVVNSKLITDVVTPIASLMGGGLGEAQPVIDQVTAVAREIRVMSEMNGSWMTSKVTIYLKPVPPAEAPVTAPAETPAAAPADAPAGS